jgi:hypothetical protein
MDFGCVNSGHGAGQRGRIVFSGSISIYDGGAAQGLD